MPRIGDAELAALDQAVSRYREALAHDRLLDAIRAGHDFHTIIITASDNGELLRSTLDRRSLIARFILLRGRATLSRNGLRNHEGILQSLRRGQEADVLARLDRMAERLISLTAERSASFHTR
jgi:DNA-binding GntR family transcriptional regulator